MDSLIPTNKSEASSSASSRPMNDLVDRFVATCSDADIQQSMRCLAEAVGDDEEAAKALVTLLSALLGPSHSILIAAEDGNATMSNSRVECAPRGGSTPQSPALEQSTERKDYAESWERKYLDLEQEYNAEVEKRESLERRLSENETAEPGNTIPVSRSNSPETTDERLEARDNPSNEFRNGDSRKLAMKESDYRAIVEESNCAFCAVDRSCGILLWNSKMEQMSGHSQRDALGRSILELWPENNSIQSIVEQALAGTPTPSFEFQLHPRVGSVKYTLLNATPFRDSHGIVTGATLVLEDITELAQHYRSVANVAQEMQQFIDTANTLIFGVDEFGMVNEWNLKTAEIAGVSTDDAFGKPLVETIVTPSQRESVAAIQKGALLGRGMSNFEMDMGPNGDEPRCLLVTATTRRTADDCICGVIYIAHDITEAARHDRAVAAMASELRQLIDTANAPIFGIDCDGDINEWNDKTAEITGFSKEEAFDCSLVETFIVPYMQDSVQNLLDNALQGRGTSNFELEFRTKSNDIRQLLVNATTRRDAENNVVGVVGVAQDVTESVQRDRAVAGMALELRQLIDTANAPIFGIDADGNVNEWNRRTHIITGYSKEETFDEPLVERFIAPSMQQKVKEILSAALQGKETSNYELEFVAKDGEPRFLLVNATTRRDPEFNVVGVVGVAQDVTEDRKHAAELRKMQYLQATQAAKVETERNMTAYFAHELRNPLGAIDSALSAMPDNLPDTARDLVSGMQLCSGFMSSIMNNLLDVRKMEEGKMTLSTRPLQLRKVVTGVQKMLLSSVKPGVSFNVVCETDNKAWVLGDEHRVQQVLTNVVTNAIKYTLKGSITLRVLWEGAFVRFECIDTGPGIPPKEQENLFQRFVQRGGAPGTGLGLAIAKHLVDLTGGSIYFISDPSVKPGTTCVVRMPLAVCESPASAVTMQQTPTVIEQALRFLIVDDIKLNRTMLKRRIMKGIAPRCTVQEASTGEDALEICGTQQFDVIIVDQYMEEAGGVMVGTDVVHAMRRMRIGAVIIGCSGNDLDSEFHEAGANFVWKKPMPTNETIIKDLKQALGATSS